MRLLPLTLAALVCGCPPPGPSGLDGGLPDSGNGDAGAFDGGPRPDGGGSDGGKLDAGPVDAGFVSAPIAQWCQLNALAQCDRDVRCLELAPANRGECLAKKSEFCDQTAYSRAVNEARLQYLEPKAVECLNGYAKDSCEEVPAACEGVFAGKVAPDGGCILAEECNAGGHCYQYDYTCPHRCRGWIAMGQGCDGFSTRCNPDDAYCGSSDAGPGERCQPLKGLGEACVEYDSCRLELTCANNQCVKRRAGPGEACGERQGFPYCSDEYFCRQDTTATPPPPGTCQRKGGVGAICAGYGSCLPSLRCGSSFTTSTCMARSAEGEKCSSYGECQQGLYCPPRTSRCAKIPGDGGDCTSQGSYFECASAHFCDFNSPDGVYTCRPRHANDESCTYDAVCLSNECDYGALPDGGYGGTCVPRCSQKADSGF